MFGAGKLDEGVSFFRGLGEGLFQKDVSAVLERELRQGRSANRAAFR
ncbi:MAG: hypothetical protein R2724_27365 [Bryobacterales bacterium]